MNRINSIYKLSSDSYDFLIKVTYNFNTFSSNICKSYQIMTKAKFFNSFNVIKRLLDYWIIHMLKQKSNLWVVTFPTKNVYVDALRTSLFIYFSQNAYRILNNRSLK